MIISVLTGCGESKQTEQFSLQEEYKSISDILSESIFSEWELVTDVSSFSGKYYIAQIPVQFSDKFAPKGTFFPDDNPCKYQFEKISGYEQRVTCVSGDDGKRFVLRHKKRI